MAIFVDWYMPSKDIGITDIMVKESGIIKYYRNKNVIDIIQNLGGREIIVVFEKPLGNLKRALAGYEHFIEDNNIRKRWYDLFVAIRRSSGYATSLSKVAKSSLGRTYTENVQRLPAADEGKRNRADVREHLASRIQTLEAVYNYAIRYDQVSFERGDTTLWAKLNINENIIDEE